MKVIPETRRVHQVKYLGKQASKQAIKQSIKQSIINNLNILDCSLDCLQKIYGGYLLIVQ
jgi:hypothetical protein